MAEQSGDPFHYLTDKLFCPKCRHICTNLKQLPCFHSVCLPCFEELQNTSGQHVITCPWCKQKSKLESVKDSPYIASLHEVKLIMSRKLSLLKCARCQEEPTTLQGNYSAQCDRFWCDNCVTQANNIHDLVPLEDIQGDRSPLKPSTYCQMEDHKGKKVKYFCTLCQTPICNYCSQTEHGTSSHEKVLIKRMASHLKSEMEILIETQLTEAQKKMDEVRRIDEEYEEVRNQETEVENDVNIIFSSKRCMTVLRRRKKISWLK